MFPAIGPEGPAFILRRSGCAERRRLSPRFCYADLSLGIAGSQIERGRVTPPSGQGRKGEREPEAEQPVPFRRAALLRKPHDQAAHGFNVPGRGGQDSGWYGHRIRGWLMNPQVDAALIAGVVSLISLGGTVVVAIRGSRATEHATKMTIEAGAENTAQTLHVQREQLERTLAEQHVRTLNERFATAAEKLGSDKPAAVRLAGVYAMAGLADDWPDNRQSCIDVLCGYLRLPSEQGPAEQADAPSAASRAEQEVRATILRLIAAHLAESARVPWHDRSFDFTGVDFNEANFSGARFMGASVRFWGARFNGWTKFTGARFAAKEVEFAYAQFSQGLIDFSDAEFVAGEVDFTLTAFQRCLLNFSRARFNGARVRIIEANFSFAVVSFSEAEFAAGAVSCSWAGDCLPGNAEMPSVAAVDLSYAKFTGGVFRFRGDWDRGNVDVTGAEFRQGQVSFSSKFVGGTIDFGGSTFTGCEVDFRNAKIAGGTVRFGSEEDYSVTKFEGGALEFSTAQFTDGAVSFAKAEFTGGTISFRMIDFTGGTISFPFAKFAGGTVRFDSDWRNTKFTNVVADFAGAEFTSGTVSFDRAEFAGGTVSFAGARFTGGTVSFSDTKFTGTTVDFSHAADWSHPPVFAWSADAAPPTGVMLPLESSGDTS